LPRRPHCTDLYHFWHVGSDRRQSSKSNFKSIDSEVWGLWVPKIWSFPLTLIVALTTVLRTTVLHCDLEQRWGPPNIAGPGVTYPPPYPPLLSMVLSYSNFMSVSVVNPIPYCLIIVKNLNIWYVVFLLQPSVRKTHCGGRKHKENVCVYYQKWLEEQVQKLVDDTSKLCCIFLLQKIVIINLKI